MNVVLLDGIEDAGRDELKSQREGVVAALRAAGHRVQVFDLRRLHVSDCTGCFHCWVGTPGECVLRDDMRRILAAMVEAERVVYVTDFHLHFMSPRLKAVIDRSLPLLRAYLRLGEDGRLMHPDRYPLRYRTLLLVEAHPLLVDDDLQAMTGAIGAHKHRCLGALRLDTPAQEICHALDRG